jgi:hypothetical protein
MRSGSPATGWIPAILVSSMQESAGRGADGRKPLARSGPLYGKEDQMLKIALLIPLVPDCGFRRLERQICTVETIVTPSATPKRSSSTSDSSGPPDGGSPFGLDGRQHVTVAMDHLPLARFASVALRGSYGHAVLLATLAVALELDAEGQVAVDDRDDVLRAPTVEVLRLRGGGQEGAYLPEPT